MNSSRPKDNKQADTSWEKVSDWYNQIVSKEGHFYHQEVIFPALMPIFLKFPEAPKKLLDLACGQGVLSRVIPKEWDYTGVDLSSSFIKLAKQASVSQKHHFFEGDICLDLTNISGSFGFATLILAMQNLANPLVALQNARKMLTPKGVFVLVLNHPSFRIPRQSSWGFDEAKKLQYRRIDSYMTPATIPIHTAPSMKENSPVVYSFHHNLSYISQLLFQAGFHICWMEEWCSTKNSDGKNAARENRSRKEFPLFLTIVAQPHS